jgi:hypothetical protein
MKTWTDRTGHAKLRSFTDADGNFWLEQNTAKRSKWATFAREGHHQGSEGAVAISRQKIDMVASGGKIDQTIRRFPFAGTLSCGMKSKRNYGTQIDQPFG